MNESLDTNQQNPDNTHRKSAVNEKFKPLKKDYFSRHRLSDQKWRQNVNKGFAALKTIVKQDRKRKSVEQLMAAEGTKEVTLNKKSSMANKRLSRIETLKSTIQLIETRESVIENLINERQQQINEMSSKRESPKSDRQMITGNGLQKIKDMFELFEKRREYETKEMSPKEMNVENNDNEKTSIEDNPCLLETEAKTADPLMTVQQIKTEVFDKEFDSNFELKSTVDFKSSEGVVDERHPLAIKKNEFDSDLDINNNDQNYEFSSDPKEYNQSLDSFRDCSPLFESFSSLDNKSFADYSYSWDPKDYLTTDLTEHLAITMPLTSFGPSLSYLNNSYV